MLQGCRLIATYSLTLVFLHQLSLFTVRSKAVQSCLILSTCYEWKIYTFYSSYDWTSCVHSTDRVVESKCMALVHSSFRVESCLVVLSVLSLSCTCGQNYCWQDKITWQVFKCISLAKTITWQQNPFCYDYKLNFLSVGWRCSQINTAEKEKFNYFLSFWVILLPASGDWRIKYMAVQSCFSVLQYDFQYCLPPSLGWWSIFRSLPLRPFNIRSLYFLFQAS